MVVVLGNHEAMNLLGDNRYTSAGEYAAFVDGQSVSRRDRVFELNKATIEAEYRAKDPKIAVDAIRQQWIAATPLGWVEHKLAWQQTGELGKWATHNPAVVKIERDDLRPRRSQRRICRARHRRDQSRASPRRWRLPTIARPPSLAPR